MSEIGLMSPPAMRPLTAHQLDTLRLYQQLGSYQAVADHRGDRDLDASKRARIRARRAEAIRRKYDDPELAARIIRMLGLPRTVKRARAKRARKAPQ